MFSSTLNTHLSPGLGISMAMRIASWQATLEVPLASPPPKMTISVCNREMSVARFRAQAVWTNLASLFSFLMLDHGTNQHWFWQLLKPPMPSAKLTTLETLFQRNAEQTVYKSLCETVQADNLYNTTHTHTHKAHTHTHTHKAHKTHKAQRSIPCSCPLALMWA